MGSSPAGFPAQNGNRFSIFKAQRARTRRLPCTVQGMPRCKSADQAPEKLPWSTPAPTDSIIARRKRPALEVKTTRMKDRVRIFTRWPARKTVGSVMSSVMDEQDVLQPGSAVPVCEQDPV